MRVIKKKPNILYSGLELRIRSHGLLIREHIVFVRSLVSGKSWPRFTNSCPQSHKSVVLSLCSDEGNLWLLLWTVYYTKVF